MKKEHDYEASLKRWIKKSIWTTTFFFLFTMSYAVNPWATPSYSQNKINLKLQNVTIQQVLNAISREINHNFFYSNAKIDVTKIITVDLKDATIDQALNQIFEGKEVDYQLQDDFIVINKISDKRILQEKTAVQQVKPVTVKGRILDDKKMPLPGAVVKIVGTSLGTATDVNGYFKIQVRKNDVLEFSFLGHTSQRYKVVGDIQDLVITLSSQSQKLEEATVIAYGERSKRELIGSVSGVKAKDLEEVPSSSVENLLQGRMAGVEVTNMSGAPGGGGTIVAVRGYNSLIDQNTGRMADYGEPLYVIDGIPVQGFSSPITGTNVLSSIDPTTIESIEVLKDAASAAIYGSRAGRGVVLITTKKGKEGQAKFSANVSYSISQLPATPTQTGGKDVRAYVIEAMRNMKRPYQNPQTGKYEYPTSIMDAYLKYGLSGCAYDASWMKALQGIPSSGESPVNGFIQDSLNPYYNNSTDWFDYAFRTGKVLNANIQASGGSQKTQYLIGAGLYNEKGIAAGSDFTRVNALINLNVQPVNNFQLDARINASYMGRNRGSGQNAQKIEVMPVDPKQTSSFLPGGGAIEEELLRTMNEQNEKNNVFDLKGSMALNYTFAPGFKLTVNGSATYNIGSINLFQPRILNADGLNTSEFKIERRLTVLNEDILSYRNKFKETHSIEVIAGFSLQKNTYNFNYGSGHGGASDKVHYIYEYFPQLPAADIATDYVILQHAQSALEETAMVSMFARFAYNYKERYLTEFTFRQDGSSVFGDKNKYANFPAIAVGWAFSEESFLNKAWWLSYGKIRASYGKSGEIFPDAYRAHGLLIPGGEYLGRPLMNVDDDALKNGGMINRELKWVKHDQYDLGLDVDFFNYRMKFKLDYYYRWSTGVIGNSKLPKTIYLYENKPINANDVSNEGLELELQADVLKTANFSWRMRFNATRNWNRLKKTFNGKDIGIYHSIDHMIGRPLYTLNVYDYDKIYENESEIPLYYHIDGKAYTSYVDRPEYPYAVGMRPLKDVNGDGKPDYTDVSYKGQTIPKVFGGWANEFYYKNFDLNLLFSYSIGRKMICNYGISSLDPSYAAQGKNVYMDLSKLKFWKKPGDANKKDIYPELSMYDATMSQFIGLTGANVENVSYMKLKQITVGYNFPKAWT